MQEETLRGAWVNVDKLLPKFDRICLLELSDKRVIVGARVLVDLEGSFWYWCYQEGSLEWSKQDGWTCGLIGDDLDVKAWQYLPEPTH